LRYLGAEKIKLSANSRGRLGHVQFEKHSQWTHIFIEIKATRTNRSSISVSRWRKLLESDVDKLIAMLIKVSCSPSILRA
jgi:hypothetical protein